MRPPRRGPANHKYDRFQPVLPVYSGSARWAHVTRHAVSPSPGVTTDPAQHPNPDAAPTPADPQTAHSHADHDAHLAVPATPPALAHRPAPRQQPQVGRPRGARRPGRQRAPRRPGRPRLPVLTPARAQQQRPSAEVAPRRPSPPQLRSSRPTPPAIIQTQPNPLKRSRHRSLHSHTRDGRRAGTCDGRRYDLLVGGLQLETGSGDLYKSSLVVTWRSDFW